MCGFAGFLSLGQCNNEVLTSMGRSVVHRGPDDQGIWLDASAGIGLAHQRLSILDLSASGHQPMDSPSGRYCIVFNGEIYNHLELRENLEGVAWRGHSDTEVLLAGFDRWGVHATIQKAIGMFGFAVWDKESRELILGRDRIGEKPVYYGWQGSGGKSAFLFGSELKALRLHPLFEGVIDRRALSLLLRHNYIPTPYSIYQNISKLTPGSLLKVSLDKREPEITPYWTAVSVIKSAVASPPTESCEELLDELEALLKKAIRQQMASDVPLGAFLSGGLDSATVVSLMQAQSSVPVKTFTIGFEEKGYNEAEHAKSVAKYLGTDHTELYVTPEDAMAVIPRLPAMYDEPFSDSSQIPTYLISQLAKQYVTVSLSGDAGDELFCGYNRYLLTEKVWGKISCLPVGLRRFAASAILALPTRFLNGTLGPVCPFLPQGLRQANIGDKLHKAAGVLDASSADELYLGLVSHCTEPSSLVLGDSSEPETLLTSNILFLANLDQVQRMMALDLVTYLPDDILVKVDRAAMSVSLETRVPFLDHRVVEFAWRLPPSMKLRGGETKWALRQILYRHVPRQMFDRPKVGFGIPLQDWLRGPLKEWAENLLEESRLRNEGFFQPGLIRQKWGEHLSRQRNWEYILWDVLMFQAWLEEERVH